MNEKIEFKKRGGYWFAIRRNIKCFGYGKTKEEALVDLDKDVEIYLMFSKNE